MHAASPTEAPISERYEFHGRLKAEFPSQIIVDATEICNMACIHCPHPEFKVSHHYSGRKLDLELNHKLVDEVREHGQGRTQYIRYTSAGEPLTYPLVFEMMDYAKRRSGVMVTLTTNGKLMNDARIERLLAIGVDIVDISIDALNPDTYARIRVGGDLNVTRSNVLRLINRVRESGSRTRVVVSYVEQPLNKGETDGFEWFWKTNGAKYVVIRRLHSCSGAKTSIASELWESSKTVPRRPCLYPWERIELNPRGDLAFCPSDWVHGSVIADYRTTTIREVWQGDFYRRLRAAHLTNDFSCHGFCGQCPDWQSTRWPNQGRSYADMVEEFKEIE
jgi:MoaA/NifB/PqqE/SkfB family radical SAM enzyme